MRIETIEIAGFAAALNALRLPFGKDVRSAVSCVYRTDANGGISYEANIAVDQKDLQLMNALLRRGPEHAKVLRGIMVYAKITAPIYWWCEMETYVVGHQRLSSESTMHIDCKGLSGDDLVYAKSVIPMGKELTKVDAFSYQALRNIARQRWDHRLPEWRSFVEWIKTLPFSRELILDGLCIGD